MRSHPRNPSSEACPDCRVMQVIIKNNLTQVAYIGEVWDQYGKYRKGRRTPTKPCDNMSFLDGLGSVKAIDQSGYEEVREMGYGTCAKAASGGHHTDEVSTACSSSSSSSASSLRSVGSCPSPRAPSSWRRMCCGRWRLRWVMTAAAKTTRAVAAQEATTALEVCARRSTVGESRHAVQRRISA